ncbi:type II secretion system protein [Massilia luteola]|uniref:type II secretion system protein n=1 Tax=Massilia luteola TaxID=3081751 RepID=UPI002ACBE018|nr:type II secretion system protein [Massilia sp. Gc5]
MKVSIKNNAQGGFTLIELIVVIVILGILAATALPKFASLGGDARLASLQAAKGSLAATAAMAHGKYLVNTGAALTTLAVEDQTINFQTSPATGYPKADTALAGAAGLSSDYTVYGPNHANDANSTSTLADEIMIVPKSVASSPTGLTCYVKYKQAASAGSAPTITMGAQTAHDCE